MKKISAFLIICIIGIAGFLYFQNKDIATLTTPTPQNTNDSPFPNIVERFPELVEWKRPEGLPRVGLQVGHWNNNQVPEELDRIRNNTGATWGSVSEWEVNYEFAIRTKEILEEQNIIVDILPATIPPSYWADVFVSIHADGSENTNKSGFKVASPRRDYTGKAESLAQYIEEEYQKVTDLEIDPVITRNMTGYYAFSWWRFEHAIHPMTTAVILETGFLSNYNDRLIIVDNPDLSTEGLAKGIVKYLTSERLI
jgi:N-acetylmuramoyl-L-alanine amidase